jgi:hypothetical protein
VFLVGGQGGGGAAGVGAVEERLVEDLVMVQALDPGQIDRDRGGGVAEGRGNEQGFGAGRQGDDLGQIAGGIADTIGYRAGGDGGAGAVEQRQGGQGVGVRVEDPEGGRGFGHEDGLGGGWRG